MLFKAFIIPDFFNNVDFNYKHTFKTIPYILHEGRYLWKEKGVIGLLNCIVLGGVVVFSGLYIGYGLTDFYLNSSRKKEITLPEKKDKEIRYEQKYIKELKNLEERELSEIELNELKNKTICEKTPEGDIIMFYNIETETYWYYTDIRNASYQTLDAVSRCYAVTYNVKLICVNYKEVWEKSKAEALAQQEKDKEEPVKEEQQKKVSSVFAKFKDYNIKKQQNRSIKRRRYRIMTDESNRFTYKGKLKDFKNEEEEEQLEKNKLSFTEFKNLQKLRIYS
jgi:hypothetical protein